MNKSVFAQSLMPAMAAVALLASVSSPAQAAPVLTSAPAAISSSGVSFGFGGGAATFTLSLTGDIFNPVAVATAGTGLVNSFGGFLGIPVAPTSNFIDRGTVTFGPGMAYTAFPTATTIPFSNGGNFVGLSFSLADGRHFGFVEFIDARLTGYGFESTPGATITAVDVSNAPSAVPEPASVLSIGMGLIGLSLLGFGRGRWRMPA